jgi:hypothetical protein
MAEQYGFSIRRPGIWDYLDWFRVASGSGIKSGPLKLGSCQALFTLAISSYALR